MPIKISLRGMCLQIKEISLEMAGMEVLGRFDRVYKLNVKEKTASGGLDKKSQKSVGGSTSETRAGTRWNGYYWHDGTSSVLFQGREYEPELNLYYFRARYYDPLMGRFLQTDPVEYADSMNLYQALNQNPMNYLDPFGNWFWSAHIEITRQAFKGEPALIKHPLALGIL